MAGEDEDNYRGSFAEAAEGAVSAALQFAEKDAIRGTVTFRSSEDNRYDAECSTLDEMASHLRDLYDEHWYANVPFDGGEAVFEADADGHVSDTLADGGFEEFFKQVREPDDAETILTARDLLKTPANSHVFRQQFNLVTSELIAHFATHPHKLREIEPLDFEKLMEAIFRNQGFDVDRTRSSKDGGFDLVLVQKDSVGAAMTLVDCKRYRDGNPVGVEIVRGLYGIVEQKRATRGMIITTSTFTSGAVKFRNDVQHRMALADYEKIKQYLSAWRKRTP